MGEKQTNGRFEPIRLLDEQLREVLHELESRGKKIEKEMLHNGWYRAAKRWQKDLEKRAKDVQKNLEKRARGVQKDLEKRAKVVQKDLEKRAKTVRRDMEKRRDHAYRTAGLATRSELDALKRKMRQINETPPAP